MNVKVSADVEAMILREMRSGRYDDVEHLLREALSLLESRDTGQLLREELTRGFAQITRGESMAYERSTMEELKQQADVNARAGQPVRDVVKP